jgi:hypothetical protein
MQKCCFSKKGARSHSGGRFGRKHSSGERHQDAQARLLESFVARARELLINAWMNSDSNAPADTGNVDALTGGIIEDGACGVVAPVRHW